MNKGKLIQRLMDITVDTGATGVIDAVGDIFYADVRELDHISVVANQITDAGTVTLLVEKTFDGTNWCLVATLTDASFAAGANKSVETSLSDGNGMPLRALAVRVRCSTYAATGTYTANVAGTFQGHST